MPGLSPRQSLGLRDCRLAKNIRRTIVTLTQGLKCRECGQHYPEQPLHVCESCFGPLEVVYDYEQIKRRLSREKIASRERNLWRYRELLPLAGEPKAGLHSGFTPLIRAER